MANMRLAARFRRDASLPVSDADRDDLTRRLGDLFTAGTIDTPVYREMLDAVYAATTNSDLVPVAEELPETDTYGVPAIVNQEGAPKPGELAEIRPASRQTLILAGGVASAVILLIALVLVVMLGF